MAERETKTVKLSKLLAMGAAMREFLAMGGIRSKLGFQIALLAQALDPHLEAFDTVRKRLVKEYGIGEKGKTPEQEQEDAKSFQEDIEEALETEAEIEFTVVELPANMEIKPSILHALAGFVKVA